MGIGEVSAAAKQGAPRLSVVVPVYKEEGTIGPFLARLEPVLERLGGSYEVLFCMDPSPDRTAEVIAAEIERNPRVKLIALSRRFGQPAATMAGILLCKGEVCAIIDVDLQDPPELIEPMYRELGAGYEVVCARRRSRKGETWVKRVVSAVGYRCIAMLSDVPIPPDTGDFRLMTRRVIEELRGLNECHGFLRGLVAYVGFRQGFVAYDRDERLAGESKYNRLVGSLKIGLNGIISFSVRPLQIMSLAGAVVAGWSFLLGGWYVAQHLAGVDLTPGLPTTVLVVTFFAGVQLLSLGLMGEYIGRVYDEVKRRPMYIVDRIVESRQGAVNEVP